LSQKLTDFVEVFLFFLLSLVIYALFILTIPIGEDSHGWIALNGFDKPLGLTWVHWLLFGSAVVCCLLGIILMRWIPALTPEVARNLWVVTYFFIWVDTVLALTLEYQTLNLLIGFVLGLIFLFLFFHLIRVLGPVSTVESYTPDWKSQLVNYWNWGWMSFYFSLSFLLVYNSFKYSDSRMPFSFGALVVCFLNYIFSLFLQRAEGKAWEGYSGRGRVFFGIWALVLILCALVGKWVF